MRARAPLVMTFQNEEDAVYRKRLRCGRGRERRRVAFQATRDDSRGAATQSCPGRQDQVDRARSSGCRDGNLFWVRSTLREEISETQAASKLAVEAKHKVYDMMYVAVGVYEVCDLITADEKLINKLGMKFPFLRWIGDSDMKDREVLPGLGSHDLAAKFDKPK